MATLLCSFEGCDRRREAKGFCLPHYKQSVRGSTLRPLIDKRTIDWRLDDQTDRAPHPLGCWLWLGATVKGGYGTLFWQGRNWGTHRLSYTRHVGEIPAGYVIDHTCHVHACLNPEHLRLATPRENSQNRAGLPSNNKSGYAGVSYNTRLARYMAYITHQRKRIHLGYFPTVEEAWEARRAKELELFTHTQLLTVGSTCPDSITYNK